MVWLTGPALGFSRNMQTLGGTSQPIGHYNFCKLYPSECNYRTPDSAPMKLNKAAWNRMVSINAKVNRDIIPMTDQDVFGVEEFWAYPKAVGDCEDYVLLKQKLLMQMGFRASDLLITIVRQTDGSGHAVLTVRTDHGDFILDNMHDEVLLWSQTDYTFLKRQSSVNTGRWTKLQDSRATFVGSIRK
nr:transglutaminase-like cysteine peptidase [Flavimaribacter sediminis]